MKNWLAMPMRGVRGGLLMVLFSFAALNGLLDARAATSAASAVKPAGAVSPASAAGAASAASEPDAAAPAASAPLTHRPLRDNRPVEPPTPTDPEVFKGYAAAPAFSVVPRKPLLALYPCSQCHKVLPLNTQPRKLVAAPHNAGLQHGKGRFWCLDCHQGNDRDVLHSVGGAKIDFDQSYLLCGQCHSARQRDWYFGGHGKRVANWQGTREIYACTHCHDPHQPTLAGRAPSKPPPVRAGLVPMVRVHEPRVMPWQRAEEAPHVGNAPQDASKP